MIYFCADDYGLCDISNEHIMDCVNNGALNKVSIFPNFRKTDFDTIKEHSSIHFSLHINLVEGKCMSGGGKLSLIADEQGNFKYTFGGLLKLNITNRKKFEYEVYKEIKEQILYYKKHLPDNYPLLIDSHQHTHMIPAVFKGLMRVLKEENLEPEYLRIPAEPLMPYIKTPSLYFTYSPVNIIKQWLLKFLWLFNKKGAKKNKIPVSYFFGILFSGKMDSKRVAKVLPKYIKLAKKDKKDLEVLFHPGYMVDFGYDHKSENIVFKNFYISENRKTEYDSVLKISERSV